MKYLAHYSTEKFQAFDYETKLQSIDKLINTLELAIGNEAERQRLIAHVIELSTYLDDTLPANIQVFISELHPKLSAHQVLNKLYCYHGGALRKDSQLYIRQGDGSVQRDDATIHKAGRITVICDNLRSVFNVGSIIRSAECLGIGKVLCCGITPTPDHPNLPKTAMGTQELVPWLYYQSTEAAICKCRDDGMQIYALETVDRAEPVFSCRYSIPLALVVGNESLGIALDTLTLCDKIVYLPQQGWKNSLNVGVATAIALYHIIFGATNG